MNKEEIIIDRVSMIDQWKTSGDVYTQDELNAIGELLDLYYKQQKEIKELEKEINNNWKDKINKLKEEVEIEQISNPYDFSYLLNELLEENK